MLTTGEKIYYEVVILYHGQETVFFIQFTKIRYQFATVQKQYFQLGILYLSQDVVVPHSKSGAVPMSSLSGVG